MKKLLSLFMICATVLSVNAQLKTPKPSPASKLEQTVGLTDISIEYSRPGVKDRAIFGDLVPYDKIWRTGANKNTIVTFSSDARINGEKLKAGSYAMFTKPREKNWEIYFYSTTDNSGVPKSWKDANVVLKTTVKVESLPFNIETFTIGINNITNDSAVIQLFWAKTYVAIPFTVPTDDAVLASINDVMGGTPTARDYYAAASYYLEENKDIQQNKEWIDKAVEMTKEDTPFYYLRKQALIYKKSGDIEGAIEAIEKSTIAAEKAGNSDYVKMNNISLEEWVAELEE